jgi:hypothetical protein
VFSSARPTAAFLTMPISSQNTGVNVSRRYNVVYSKGESRVNEGGESQAEEPDATNSVAFREKRGGFNAASVRRADENMALNVCGPPFHTSAWCVANEWNRIFEKLRATSVILFSRAFEKRFGSV